jgi:hypothetical protein
MTTDSGIKMELIMSSSSFLYLDYLDFLGTVSEALTLVS